MNRRRLAALAVFGSVARGTCGSTFAFQGDIDFIRTEHYSREQAERALTDARFVVDIVGRVPMSG